MKIMGIHFKTFCDKARKTRNGHVPDLLDMSTEEKDAAVVAALRDDGMLMLACAYGAFSEERKNSVYQSYEWIIRDNIEKYNLAVDIENEQPRITAVEQML